MAEHSCGFYPEEVIVSGGNAGDLVDFTMRPGTIVCLESPPAAPTLLSESESLTVLIEAMRTSAQDTLAALTRAGYCLARK